MKQRRNRYALFGHEALGRIAYWKFPDGILRSLSRVNLTEDSKILDIGCGSGNLLRVLKRNGFKNLLGIDKYIKEDVKYENGLEIQKAVIQEVEGKWDLVLFNHSLEHMPDQLETLQVVSELLTKEGICLINLPTVSSYAWKNYRTNWVQLDAPRHFYLHSVESLTILSEKARLRLRDIFYNSTAFQFWGSELYVRGIPLSSCSYYYKNPSDSIFPEAKIRMFNRRAKKLNQTSQGDQAAFYFAWAK
jgi:SAM-dependent methyltransferase